MKRVRFLQPVLLCLLVAVFFPQSTAAQTVDPSSFYSEQYEASGAGELQRLVPEEAQGLLDSMNISPENAAESFSFSAWAEALSDTFRARAAAPLRTLGICLCAVVIGAFAKAINAGTLSHLPEDFGGMAVFAALAFPLAQTVDAAAAAIRGAGTFLLGAVPVYAGVLAAMGKSISAGAFGTLMVAAGNCVTLLTESLVLPLLYILLTFAAVSSLSVPEVSRIGDAVYSTAKWVLVFAVTFFTGLLTVQGLLSGAADTAAGKTAKLVVKNAVPLVGGLISDAAGAVQASVSLLRSGIGAFALLALLAVFLPLLLENAVWIFVLFLSGMAANLFGLSKLSGLFSSCKTVLQTLFACTVSCGTILLICAGIILAAGNSA